MLLLLPLVCSMIDFDRYISHIHMYTDGCLYRTLGAPAARRELETDCNGWRRFDHLC
jgi:hypothetical protein